MPGMHWLPSLCIIFLFCASKVVFPSPAPRLQKKVVRFCELCNAAFDKVGDFERHLTSKRHLDSLTRSKPLEALWEDFVRDAPHWSVGCSPQDIEKKWVPEELSSLGLRQRKQCLHPSTTLQDLSPYQRARIWRYLRDMIGKGFYPEVARAVANLDHLPNSHMRMKELFESVECFRKIETFIVDARKTLKAEGLPLPSRVLDLASGHGLVAVLLAYRFNDIEVHAFDLYRRPSFNVLVDSFEMYALKRPGAEKVLPNLIFHECDLSQAAPLAANSIIACIHGCGEVNQKAVEMAMRHNACGWVVVPCCINKQMYLGDHCSVGLRDDQMRHWLLCGAFSQKYKAQMVEEINPIITNRAVVIAGGVNCPQLDSGVEHEQQQPDNLLRAVRRGYLPRLQQS